MTQSSASAQLNAFLQFHSLTPQSDVPNAIRDALIYAPDSDFDADWAITDFERETIESLVHRITTDPDEREGLTEIALSLSLCPIHLHDYAICFDDDDAECAQVRMIHPSHDS